MLCSITFGKNASSFTVNAKEQCQNKQTILLQRILPRWKILHANFIHKNLSCTVFIGLFPILKTRNFQLESDDCCLPKTWFKFLISILMMIYNMTARCCRYVSPQMICSLLEFSVAQWLVCGRSWVRVKVRVRVSSFSLNKTIYLRL